MIEGEVGAEEDGVDGAVEGVEEGGSWLGGTEESGMRCWAEISGVGEVVGEEGVEEGAEGGAAGLGSRFSPEI